MRWRKAAVSVTAVVLALGVAAGCSETDPDEARTPEGAATVVNSAAQTNSEGETVAAPGSGAPEGGEAGAQTNTGVEVEGGGVTDDLGAGSGGGEEGGGGEGGGGGGETLEIPADEQALAYQVTEVSAPAGEVTLSMPNPSAIPHNIAVDEPEQALGEVVTQGAVSEITVEFPAGDYEYYCSVPGHREAGMVGTLTVE